MANGRMCEWRVGESAHEGADGAGGVGGVDDDDDDLGRVDGDPGGGHEGLRRAVLTAIARHHSPQARGFDEKYRLDPAAQAAVAEALEAAGLADGKSQEA